MIEKLNRVPAVPALAGWAAGILLWYAGCGWWLAAVAAAAGVAMTARRQYALMSVLYALSGGWSVAYLNQPVEAPAAVLDGRELQYAATVRTVRNTPGATTVVADIDSVAGQPCGAFGVQIASVPDWMPPRVGDVIRFTASLEPPEPSGNYRHAPDYSSRYLADGVVATAYVDGEIHVCGYRGGFRAYMAARRDAIVAALARSNLSDEAYGLLAALITGYTDDIGTGIKEGYKATGIAHALALSGFHVGVVVVIVSLMLFPLRAWPQLRRWRLAAGLLAVWIYAFMTGMPDSVFRAVLMLSIYTFGIMLNRGVSHYNTLCSAILIILALRPYSLFSAGFQLSVCAVLGILVFADKFNPVDPRRHRLHTLVAPLAVACAALIGTMPVTLAVFHRLPLLFLLSNVLVAIMLPMLMFGGILLLLCLRAGIGSYILCICLNHVTDCLNGAVVAMTSVAEAVVSGIYLTPVQSVLLLAAIAAAGFALHVRRRYAVVACAAAILLFCTSGLWAGEKIPGSEAFLLPIRGNTAIVARHGCKAVATLTCHERHTGNAQADIERMLEHYLAACGVDTLVVTAGEFSLGPYARRADMFYAGDIHMAMLVNSGIPDSLAESPDYAIVGGRCRLSPDDIARLIHPDTLVLGYDLSPGRRRELAATSIPDIDLNE